jgi:pilus assembly protein CpaF
MQPTDVLVAPRRSVDRHEPRRVVPAALSEWPRLGDLAADPAVTDLILDPRGTLWIDRGAGLVAADAPPIAEQQARSIAVGLIAAGDRHLDEATPCVDVHLGDGIRVHAVLPPIVQGGSTVAIRLPRLTRLSLEDLAGTGYFSRVSIDVVTEAIAQRRNVLVTGASGAGKTTLLAAMLASAPPGQRIVVIEDVAELRIAHPQVTVLEARQPNLEGAGGIGLALLVRQAMRMRPDRLVVGECRGPELIDMLAALNTGHDGGAGTLHANSLADVPARLEMLGESAGLSARATARQAASAFDLVLHCGREGFTRVLDQAGRLVLRGSRLSIEPLCFGTL